MSTFEIFAPWAAWGYFDPVTSETIWFVSAGFWLQGWICTHWSLLSGGCSPRQWSQQHWIFSVFLLTGDLNLLLVSQQGAWLESSLTSHWTLFPVLPVRAEILNASSCFGLGVQRPVTSAQSLTCFHSISHPQRCLWWVWGHQCVLNVLLTTVIYHHCKSRAVAFCLDFSLCFLPGRTNGIS